MEKLCNQHIKYNDKYSTTRVVSKNRVLLVALFFIFYYNLCFLITVGPIVKPCQATTWKYPRTSEYMQPCKVSWSSCALRVLWFSFSSKTNISSLPWSMVWTVSWHSMVCLNTTPLICACTIQPKRLQGRAISSLPLSNNAKLCLPTKVLKLYCQGRLDFDFVAFYQNHCCLLR